MRKQKKHRPSPNVEVELSIDSLSNLCEKIDQCSTTDEIAQVLIQRAVELPGAKSAAVFLVDEETYEFAFNSAIPAKNKHLFLKEIELQTEEGTFPWVIKNRRSITVPPLAFNLHEPNGHSSKNDTNSCLPRCAAHSAGGRERERAISLVPLVAARKTIGVVLVGFINPPEAISQNLSSFISTIARQSALAIKNISFVDNLEKQNEALKRLTDDLRSSRAKMERYSKSLEEQVQMRTLKLEALNEELEAANKEILERMKKQKELQHQLIRSEKLASIGTLAGGVAHEFNNLLTGIIGFAEVALRKQTIESMKKALTTTLALSRRGCDITNNLLGFARNANGEISSANIVEVLEKTIALIVYDFKKRNIKIIRNFQEVPPTPIDVGQIQQVFLNMLTNARDAMEGGGKLTITVKREGDTVLVIFEDTGCGIVEGDFSRVFDPFFTTKGALGGGNCPGTGLGLSISYGIIEEHGGKIHLESEEGKGTKFTIVLPLRRPTVPAPPVASATQTGTRAGGRDLPTTPTGQVTDRERN